jgi:extracellular matrix regulatory protein A
MSNKDNGLGAVEPGGVNIGYGNFVLPKRIVAILESGSLPMKRLRERSQQACLLLDATAGRKTRSLIVLDSRHVVLSALAPQTLHDRLRDTTQRADRLSEFEGGELVS